MDIESYEVAEAFEYSLESLDSVDYGPVLEASSAVPGGMEAAAVVALLGGSSYFLYNRASEERQSLEEKYLED